jgi:hypothetical protein
MPSLKYDALCLLKTLSGDPFYLPCYQREYDHFHPLFAPEEQASFVQSKRVLKEQGRYCLGDIDSLLLHSGR